MESKDYVNWYVPTRTKLMIKQIHMCEFVENNWDIETYRNLYGLHYLYEFIQTDAYQKIKQISMSRTNSYCNQWWYQLVCGDSYSWRLNNLYVWLLIKKELTLFVQICTTLLFDINCSCMNETNGNSLMWVLSNQDKLLQGGTARKMMQEEKAIYQDTSFHPSTGTLEKCQSDAVSHRTNQYQWHRTESQQWPEITKLAIQKSYTNWYNWNWN